MRTGSAQLDFQIEEDAAFAAEPRQVSDLRLQVAERLQLHRQRRSKSLAVVEDAAPSTKSAGARDKIAAAVAERYAQTPSYRAVLAEEARRANERAAAAAVVAQRNADAVAAEHERLLSELELWDAPQDFSADTAVIVSPDPPPASRNENAGLTVRLYEDLNPAADAVRTSTSARSANVPNAAETLALDAEIAFRQAPVFEQYSTEPPVPLPANLLEFPRQLVAARKARPVLAEGPLLEEAKARSKQLRIFEVEPELITAAPPPVTNAPEWSSIRLDAHTVTAVEAHPNVPPMPVLASLLPPQAAPLELRAMAAIVDALLVTAALLAFVGVFAKLTGAIPTGVPAMIAAGSTFAAFYVLYQLLFFALAGHTPGMRYARIGLCTFSDENPSRIAMCKRILAQAVAVCPLGLGVLWALLDDDGLGWHDRISRMYQRAY